MSDEYFTEAARVFDRLAANRPPELEDFVEAIFSAWSAGGRVVSFGNGGSATDSLHFTTELVAKFDEAPIHRPAISLAASPSTLTATGNDWSFEELFSRQIEAQVTDSDVLLGISTSGNSSNVIKGLRAGREIGARCFGLTGESGGRMAELDLELIRVPAEATAHVQEAHISCLHWICRQVDNRLNS